MSRALSGPARKAPKARRRAGARPSRGYRPLPYARVALASLPALWLGLDYVASLRPAPHALQVALGIAVCGTCPLFLLPALAFVVFFVAAHAGPPNASSRVAPSESAAPAAAGSTLRDVAKDPRNLACGLVLTFVCVGAGGVVSALAYVAPPYGSIAAFAGLGVATAVLYGVDADDDAPAAVPIAT